MLNAETNDLLTLNPSAPTKKNHLVIQPSDVEMMFNRYQYSAVTRQVIQQENLLPIGLLSRLHASFPQHSGLLETKPFIFNERDNYTGLKGFHRVIENLKQNGIELDHMNDL